MSITTHRTLVARVLLGSCACFPIALVREAPAQSGVSQASQSQPDRLLAGGHYLRAEQPLRAAVQRVPNDAHALSDLSIVDWAFNRLDAAIADAERAVAASPNSAEAHSKLADALGAKLVASNTDPRVGTFAKISLAHRFRKEIDRTLELDPNDVDALQDLAQFYWHAPGMVGGDKQKARQTADRLFTVSPFRGAETRADFVQIDNDNKNEQDISHRNAALQAIWQRAVSAQPESYDARAALAAAYLEETGGVEHLSSAETEAKRALAIDPSRINAYSVLAVVYARTGRWNECDALLKQARERIPEDRTPEYATAVAILNGNLSPQFQKAEQLLRNYLAQSPEGQAPSHATAHWRLGQLLEKQGRKADAVRELQAAVQQDGSLEGAKKDLKRLS